MTDELQVSLTLLVRTATVYLWLMGAGMAVRLFLAIHSAFKYQEQLSAWVDANAPKKEEENDADDSE